MSLDSSGADAQAVESVLPAPDGHILSTETVEVAVEDLRRLDFLILLALGILSETFSPEKATLIAMLTPYGPTDCSEALERIHDLCQMGPGSPIQTKIYEDIMALPV